MEARQQEIATGREPGGDITNTPSGGSCVHSNVWANRNTAPAVCRAALFQTDISNALQLHQQKLDRVVCHVRGLGEPLLKPGINPGGKSVSFTKANAQ